MVHMRIDPAYTIIRSWDCEQKLTIFDPRFHDFMDNQKLGMEPQMADQTGHQLGEDFRDNYIIHVKNSFGSALKQSFPLEWELGQW